MGKTNFRRMMMLRDHDKDREPERDRLEEERDRRERELERRLRKLEDGNDRHPSIRRKKTATSTPTLSPATLT